MLEAIYMSAKTFVTGALYHIKFLDHYIGENNGMTCEICAWVINQDKNYLYLAWWITHSQDEETFAANLEKVSLLKATVVARRRIGRQVLRFSGQTSKQRFSGQTSKQLAQLSN